MPRNWQQNATREPRSPSDAICSAAGGSERGAPRTSRRTTHRHRWRKLPRTCEANPGLQKKVLLKYGCENSNNILSYVWGFLGQMQIFELKHFENHYRNNLVNSRLSKRDVGSHDEASAPSSASSTCWPARMCAARSARVGRLAGGRTSWQNVAKLLQRLASFRLYPHRFLHAKRKHRRKYFMPSTKTAELTLANGL